MSSVIEFHVYKKGKRHCRVFVKISLLKFVCGLLNSNKVMPTFSHYRLSEVCVEDWVRIAHW